MGKFHRTLASFGLAVALASLAGALATTPLHSATLKTLYSFCAKASCADGKSPYGGLLRDSLGNLYGMTNGGGAHGGGSIFELAFDSTSGGWSYRRLYNFCAKAFCADGNDPYGSLIVDEAGNLYGTTHSGGSWNEGTAFELSPNADRTKWKLKILHAFCTQAFCADGSLPTAGLTYVGAAAGVPYDGVSPLYGTACRGGSGDVGVIFQLTPVAGAIHWREKVLHAFSNGDGATPQHSLIADAFGDLYGPADGGPRGHGLIFELRPNVRKTLWTETILYNFCSKAGCADGGSPGASTLMDASGNLFSTTVDGGITHGVAFQLLPSGASWNEIVLHDFCTSADCVDGITPGNMVMDASGNLFGMTISGGGNDSELSTGAGTIFELNGSYSVLHSFCALPDCTDGETPTTEMIVDAGGNLFGTTTAGGKHGWGTVFEVIP